MGRNSGTMQLFGGDWTEQKLAVLGDYLHSYGLVLKGQPFTRVYVDAFAGTGYRQQRSKAYHVPDLFREIYQQDSQELLKGSAKLALEADPPFHRYVFVETDERKVQELNKLKAEHPGKASQIQIVQGDANEFMQAFCRREKWAGQRAVVFLDPFATEVSWSTVEAIANTHSIDLWYLFPLMAVNRLLANDPAKACRDRLDDVFGTPEWFQRFYKTRRLEDIFGQPLETIERACDYQAICDFFQERLRTVFVGVASTRGILTNSRGTPLFRLFFAVGNKKGAPIALRIAEHLLKRV